MPTEQNVKAVDELRGWMEQSTIVITADYSGLPVGQMTNLRRALRERDVQFRVVKNSLAILAADAAGKPEIKGIIEGPTGIAFGYADATEPAKALAEFIRSNRSTLKIIGGVMGDRALTADEVRTLATLPPKEELIARLAGQLQGQIASLAYVLNAPIAGFARVLQRHIENAEQQA